MEGRSWTWKASFVAVRIVAVYLVVHALILAGSSSGFLVSGGIGLTRWAVIVAIIVLAVAGVELWLVADGVANRIANAADELDLPPDEDDEAEQPRVPRSTIDPTTALSIGLTLLGIVVLLDGLAGLIVTIGQLTEVQQAFGGISRSPLYFSLLTQLLRIAVGAWLTFGSHEVAGLLRRLRVKTSGSTESTP